MNGYHIKCELKIELWQKLRIAIDSQPNHTGKCARTQTLEMCAVSMGAQIENKER